jgi:hypothetical protein
MRYYNLNADTNQLAIIPGFIEKIGEKYAIDIELFASALNTNCNTFASLYIDIEKTFGSAGYFNNINPLIHNLQNIIIANPPFDEDIMLIMMKKLLIWLSYNIPITILITIPKWGDYSTFKAYNIIEHSPYLKYSTTIPKSHAMFYNSTKDKYINPCPIYILLLQNDLGYLKFPSLATDIDSYKNIIYYNSNSQN